MEALDFIKQVYLSNSVLELSLVLYLLLSTALVLCTIIAGIADDIEEYFILKKLRLDAKEQEQYGIYTFVMPNYAFNSRYFYFMIFAFLPFVNLVTFLLIIYSIYLNKK
jgi:hypothetical protein